MGTTRSSTRKCRPLCSAQISPACTSSTTNAITALRLKGWGAADTFEKAEAIIGEFGRMQPQACHSFSQS